jgi:hypothetical protein
VVSNDLIVGDDSESDVGRMKEWRAAALSISQFLDREVEKVLTPLSRIGREWIPLLVLL